MKSYTNIEQSMKLAKFLPLESADMAYIKHSSSDNPIWRFDNDMPPMILGNVPINEMTVETLPCWSLAALLCVLPNYQLQTQNDGIEILCSCNGNFNIVTADNSVDACYELILKLHELNLL